MKILVIDTATEACSAALMNGEGVSEQFSVSPQQHSQLILGRVEALLQEAQLSVSDLDYLGFGRGPGSFTGVRIATGVIQGLAMAANVPVVAISTLAAMAQQAYETKRAKCVVAAIDARMGEVYFGIYRVDDKGVMQLQGEEQVLPPEQAKALIESHSLAKTGFYKVGTGWDAYPELNEISTQDTETNLEVDILYPNARYMLPLAEQDIESGKTLAIDEIEPVYLRDKVTWKKLPGRE